MSMRLPVHIPSLVRMDEAHGRAWLRSTKSNTNKHGLQLCKTKSSGNDILEYWYSGAIGFVNNTSSEKTRKSTRCCTHPQLPLVDAEKTCHSSCTQYYLTTTAWRLQRSYMYVIVQNTAHQWIECCTIAQKPTVIWWVFSCNILSLWDHVGFQIFLLHPDNLLTLCC